MKNDMTGARVGRLVVVARATDHPKDGGSRWQCRCDCGEVAIVKAACLRRKDATKSCGCLQRETPSQLKHGMYNTPTYRAWDSMKRRCYNKQNHNYHQYGARGISVCNKWRARFEDFLADMGVRPDGRSLDRVDNNGNYEPSNCRWATAHEQAANRRSTVFLTAFGKTKTIMDWSTDHDCKVHQSVIYKRISMGWSGSDAITRPVRRTARPKIAI